jgi:hypothetical protein
VVFDLYDIPSCNLFLPFPSSEVTSGSVFLVAKELFFLLVWYEWQKYCLRLGIFSKVVLCIVDAVINL